MLISGSERQVVQVDLARRGAERYSEGHGFHISSLDFKRVVANPRRGARIAAAYMAAPVSDPAALPAYRMFIQETARQFEFMTEPRRRGGLGLEVEVCPVDPYPDAATMTYDVAEHGHLQVYATRAGDNKHPVLTDDENDMFRAVHDYFGHAAIGRGFDRHGEEAAWLHHGGMYSRLARRALTTETRGTNSTLVYFYRGRRFPEQKAMLLPERFCDLARVTLLPASS